MKRERIDKQMSREILRRVMYPFLKDLGARHLVPHPYMTGYNHENKHIQYGLGHKKHGDKRHRSTVRFEGIHYADGRSIEGPTTTVEIDHRVGWVRKIDNRKVATPVTVSQKIALFEEEFNTLKTENSLDIVNNFSASAQGTIAGIGGTVSTSTTTSIHSQVNTEKMNHTKKERIIEDVVALDYPGPILWEEDQLRQDGYVLARQGSIRYPGEVWLIERPVLKLQTKTPMTQWGVWDCGRLIINVYDWAGNYGALPGGKHKNVLELAGLSELLDLMKGNLVLQYPWSAQYRPSFDVRAGMAWLEEESKREVGPVEWDRVRLNEDVASIEPSIVTPA